MPLSPALLVILLVVLVAAAWLIGKWLSYRGERLVTCPENRRAAGVRVDAAHAALTAWPKAALRLSTCSRWPERVGCGQECLRQVEQSPADCLVRNIVARWYEGKRCASCGQEFSEIRWEVQQPALRRIGQPSIEWKEVSADKLPEILEHAEPICFACHMATTLMRQHPELVVDRHRGPVGSRSES